MSELPSLRRYLQSEDGAQHLLFHDSGQYLQVYARGADLAEPAHLLTETISSPNVLKHQLRSQERFNIFYAGRTPGQKPFQLDRSSQKLRIALRVLDGRLAGASYRDIAIALFGRDRIKEDWNAPDDHLKNRIRRAAQRGVFLMEGGYRGLLK